MKLLLPVAPLLELPSTGRVSHTQWASLAEQPPRPQRSRLIVPKPRTKPRLSLFLGTTWAGGCVSSSEGQGEEYAVAVPGVSSPGRRLAKRRAQGPGGGKSDGFIIDDSSLRGFGRLACCRELPLRPRIRRGAGADRIALGRARRSEIRPSRGQDERRRPEDGGRGEGTARR